MRYRDFFPLKHSYNVISGIQVLPACHLRKGGEVNQLSLHYGQEPWQAVAVDHPADARGCWGHWMWISHSVSSKAVFTHVPSGHKIIFKCGITV